MSMIPLPSMYLACYIMEKMRNVSVEQESDMLLTSSHGATRPNLDD